MLAAVRSGERLPLAVAFVTLLGLSAAQALLETARDTLLLWHVPIARLPWLTLGSAALGLLLIRLPRWLGAGRWRLSWLLGLGAGLTASLLLLPREPWFAAVLHLWTGAFAAGAGVELWSSLGRLFHLGQAKRLYGLIAAGGGIGAVLGAGLARLLLGAGIAPHALLGAAAAILALTAAPALGLGRLVAALPQAPADPPVAPCAEPARPYAHRVLAFVFLAWMAFTLLELQFKVGVLHAVAAPAIGPFLATMQMVTGGVAVLVQLFLLGPLLRTVRLHRTLPLLPAALTAGTVAVVAGAGFPVVAAVKAIDASFRQPLFRTAGELLYAPLGARSRRWLKTWADLGGARAGQAVAAVAALIVLGLEARFMAALLGVVLILWLIATIRVGAAYLRMLRVQIEPARVGLPDESTAALAEVGGPAVVATLQERLLVEQDSRVRRRVLRTLLALRRRDPTLRFDDDVLGRVAWRAIEVILLCLDWRLQLVDGTSRRPDRAGDTHQRLLAVLEDKRRRALEQLFLVLALRHPDEDFTRLRAGLASADPRVRAASRELLGTTLEGPARTLTLLLFTEIPDDQRLAEAAPLYRRHTAPTYRDLLLLIAREGGGQLTSLAVAQAAESAERRDAFA